MKNIIEMLEEESKKDKLFRSAAIEWLSELEWADYSYEEITEYMQSLKGEKLCGLRSSEKIIKPTT